MKSETDGSRHLRLRGVDKNGSVILEPIRSHQTTDMLLTPPTDAEVLAYLRALPRMNPGEIWDGNARFRDAKAALDRLTVSELRDTLAGLAEYAVARPDGVGSYQGPESSEVSKGPAGSLTFGGTKDKGGNAMRVWRNQDFRRIEETQAALDKFYNPTKPAA
jgi:hypothetical protein